MGHLRDENHLIDVHLAEMWAPDEEEGEDTKDEYEEEDDDDNNYEENYEGDVEGKEEDLLVIFFWICW